VLECFGDSTRGGEWAAVRLLVDGDRIVEADAPELERSLTGLTLLEAAARTGRTPSARAVRQRLCSPRARRAIDSGCRT
jgi:hypothetical protein